jgi:hypothetical protein
MLHLRRFNEDIVQPTTQGNHYNQEILDILNIAKDEDIDYTLEYRSLRIPHDLAADELQLYNGMIHTIRMQVTTHTQDTVRNIVDRLCNIHDIHIQCINSYDGTAYESGYSMQSISQQYAAHNNATLVIRMLPIVNHEAYGLHSMNTYYYVHIAMYKNLCILYSNNFLPVSRNIQNKIVKTNFLHRDLVTGSRASYIHQLYRGRVIGDSMTYEEINHEEYPHKYIIDIAPFSNYID